jgi:peptidoglycan hydrolase-like protein with peptidoglycan-binding domain
MYAPPVSHCKGIDVDHPTYQALTTGSTETAQVKALQCLLKEKGRYEGKLNGKFNAATLAAARDWQTDHGFPAGDTWTRTHWMNLLADGASPVLKYGSAGEDVRRVQRALKAAGASKKLRITGRYTTRTKKAVAAWQDRVGQSATGIMVGRSWKALRAGRR